MKEQEKIQQKNSYIAHSLTGILDIIICLLLFISSIYKGAFYKSDFLFPNVIITVIGAIYLIYKIVKEIISKKKDGKPRSKVKVLLDIFMLILPISYALPIIFKTYVSLPDSIYEMLRYVNMTVIYFIARSTKNEHIYLNIFVLIALTQAILGIDQMTYRCFENFLNSISTGYLPDTERLSATVQYANVTGIVILLGVIVCFNYFSNISEKKSKIKYIELLISVFILLLLITGCVLTESRVVVVTTFVLLLLDAIVSVLCINKRLGINKFMFVVYAGIVSNFIENIITKKHYYMIYICLLIFALLYIAMLLLSKLIKKYLCNKIEVKNKLVIKNKCIKYIILALCFAFIVVFLGIPTKLKINSIDGKTTEIVRSIYDFKEGKNNIKINMETLEDDTRYSVSIVEVRESFYEEIIATYNYYDKTSASFDEEIGVSKGVRYLKVIIKVQKGSLKINSLRLNDKNIKLSYLLIPDSIAFKIKDTIYGVHGDSLRLEYAKDSFKLLKQSPIIGVGGEGFKHTYGSVQTIRYVSSEAHSAILQSLVEVGIVGTSLLIGIILLAFCILLKLIIRLRKISIQDKKYVMTIISLYISIVGIMLFDLAFSYAFMIYIFAIIIALLLKIYIDILEKYNERTERQSKLDWSYIKIIVLSLSAVLFIVVSYFSINAYRASVVRIPNKGEELNAAQVMENIAYLELKVKQDNFDMDYIRELNEEYEKYKELVTQAYVNSENNKEVKVELKKELDKVIVNIKENADKMLEYEYYDKFVLNDVANTYIENYIAFSDIYKEKFSSLEVAYTFYLNYVLKLADRIIEINPISKKAHELYNNMCIRYVQELKEDNKYLNSKAISDIIKEFEKRVK